MKRQRRIAINKKREITYGEMAVRAYDFVQAIFADRPHPPETETLEELIKKARKKLKKNEKKF